jgi:hypothetical protein
MESRCPYAQLNKKRKNMGTEPLPLKYSTMHLLPPVTTLLFGIIRRPKAITVVEQPQYKFVKSQT